VAQAHLVTWEGIGKEIERSYSVCLGQILEEYVLSSFLDKVTRQPLPQTDSHSQQPPHTQLHQAIKWLREWNGQWQYFDLLHISLFSFLYPAFQPHEAGSLHAFCQ
jgi:hypothetical protein